MKKCIKYLAIIAIITTVSSCVTDEASNPKLCLENVQRVYPNSKIYQHPKSGFKFLVVDSTGVREVTTLNLSSAYVDGIVEYKLLSK